MTFPENVLVPLTQLWLWGDGIHTHLDLPTSYDFLIVSGKAHHSNGNPMS